MKYPLVIGMPSQILYNYKRNKVIFSVLMAMTLLLTAANGFAQTPATADEQFVSYTADIKKQQLQLFWKDDKGNLIMSLQNLATWVETKGKKLLFAMNAGMYKTDHTPLGLFIDAGKTIAPLNKASANGNFYLKPNGVFYTTTDNKAVICKTEDFAYNRKIKYATQSGPMLVVDGQVHPAFKKGSENLNIRNGVGILPDGRVVFAMSKSAINFYDFADYFMKLGCKNALYLDGFVSRTWLPEAGWKQTDGDFGVMVGVVQ